MNFSCFRAIDVEAMLFGTVDNGLQGDFLVMLVFQFFLNETVIVRPDGHVLVIDEGLCGFNDEQELPALLAQG